MAIIYLNLYLQHSASVNSHIFNLQPFLNMNMRLNSQIMTLSYADVFLLDTTSGQTPLKYFCNKKNHLKGTVCDLTSF